MQCIRALIFKGAIARESVLRDQITDSQQYEAVQALIHSTLEPVRIKFNFPDIESTQFLLQSEPWQWDFIWRTVMQQEPKLNKKGLFEGLPHEIKLMIGKDVFDGKLTELQIGNISHNATNPAIKALHTIRSEKGTEVSPETSLSLRPRR